MVELKGGFFMSYAPKVVDYCTLDVGTQGPAMGELNEIGVEIIPQEMFQTYILNLVSQTHQRASNEAQRVDLEAEELEFYFSYLLSMRIRQVRYEKMSSGKLQELWYPNFFIHCLQMIGRVLIRPRAILLFPVMMGLIEDTPENYQRAVKVSFKLETLNHVLRVTKGGFPRSVEGNADVMSVALVKDRVRAVQHLGHVAMSFIGAVLNFTLDKEVAFKSTHPVLYDDVKLLQSALLFRSELY